MPYLDKQGEFITFKRKAGEGISDPEYAKVTCPACDKYSGTKTTSRSVYRLAEKLNWVVLPTTNALYCSRQCAQVHAPESYQRHLDSLTNQQYELQLDLRKWHLKE